MGAKRGRGAEGERSAASAPISSGRSQKREADESKIEAASSAVRLHLSSRTKKGERPLKVKKKGEKERPPLSPSARSLKKRRSVPSCDRFRSQALPLIPRVDRLLEGTRIAKRRVAKRRKEKEN